MRAYQTSNPVLSKKMLKNVSSHYGVSTDNVMSIEGTINKTFLVLGITALAAFLSWGNPTMASFSIPAAIVGFVIALIIAFKPKTSSYLVPVYALVEGVFLGVISNTFEVQYQGIVTQAILLTLAVTVSMLILYRSKLIKVTHKFKMGMFAATGAIALVYMGSFIYSFFSSNSSGFSFLHSSSPLSIGISVVVVVIASLNLVIDFDRIREFGESNSAPKFMEWYGAFSILVTLIWLYIELLRLLAKIKDR